MLVGRRLYGDRVRQGRLRGRGRNRGGRCSEWRGPQVGLWTHPEPWLDVADVETCRDTKV